MVKHTLENARSPIRFNSIDLIRGGVMILMAIDHVRVYSGLPAGGPEAGIFFTRWVTHFCAPAFLFLAGTSAYLYGRKRAGLSGMLVTRGAWLILMELTLLRLAWTFNVDFGEYMMAGVIWVIGWGMILLAGLVRFPLGIVAAIGLVVMAGHNVLDPYFDTLARVSNERSWGGLLKILYVSFFAGPIAFGSEGPYLTVLYSLVPWVGVMATGYAFGAVLLREPEVRDRLCLYFGLGAIALFLVLRGLNLYGDPNPWTPAATGPDGAPAMPGFFSFLGTTKYPASLSFLLMTLGPSLALIPVLERVSGPIARWVAVFGRVPFFYYVLHIPLIHGLALIVSKVRHGTVDPWLFANHPMGNPPAPEAYVWSLSLLYVVFALTVFLLYFPCRWFAGVKARRPDRWLSYL
jgi:uncharacterized membrane protein